MRKYHERKSYQLIIHWEVVLSHHISRREHIMRHLLPMFFSAIYTLSECSIVMFCDSVWWTIHIQSYPCPLCDLVKGNQNSVIKYTITVSFLLHVIPSKWCIIICKFIPNKYSLEKEVPSLEEITQKKPTP